MNRKNVISQFAQQPALGSPACKADVLALSQRNRCQTPCSVSQRTGAWSEKLERTGNSGFTAWEGIRRPATLGQPMASYPSLRNQKPLPELFGKAPGEAQCVKDNGNLMQLNCPHKKWKCSWHSRISDTR